MHTYKEVLRDIETTIFDPASVFLNHIDKVRNKACYRSVSGLTGTGSNR